MTQFIRFRTSDTERFVALQKIFAEIKAVKNLDFPTESDDLETRSDLKDYDAEKIRNLMPPDVQSNFIWPTTSDERDEHRLPSKAPVAISPPGALLGVRWSVIRILDLIDICEYSLEHCHMVDEFIAEMHVRTWSYPYGGLNALIALVEGFGFQILGVDECGEYESRQELEQSFQREELT